MGELENRLIAAATPKYFKGVSDLVAKELVPYWWLKKHDRIEHNLSGRGAEWRVRLRRGTPIGYSGGVESINFAARNDREVATLAYRGLADGFMLTWAELQEAKGKEAIFNLLEESTADLDSDLLDALITDFYLDGTTRSSKTIHGIAAFLSASATYAGLSQTTNANWQAQVVTGAGFGSDPIGRIVRLKNACAKGEKGGKTRSRISIALASDTDWEVLHSKFQSQQRCTYDKEMANAGFDALMVGSLPVVRDEYCTANTIFGLNHQSLKFCTTTPDIFASHQSWADAMPYVYTGVALGHFNLFCFNPRANGIMANTNT